MQKIQHYVLFPNHDNGMRLYGILIHGGTNIGKKLVLSEESIYELYWN